MVGGGAPALSDEVEAGFVRRRPEDPGGHDFESRRREYIIGSQVSGCAPAVTKICRVERGIAALERARKKDAQDASIALSLAVARYLRIAQLPPVQRTQARDDAWSALYDVELMGRRVAGHPEVKALHQAFDVDIPEHPEEPPGPRPPPAPRPR